MTTIAESILVELNAIEPRTLTTATETDAIIERVGGAPLPNNGYTFSDGSFVKVEAEADPDDFFGIKIGGETWWIAG